jgi:hypothetical protein
MLNSTSTPLAQQDVAANDGVLGAIRSTEPLAAV